MRADVNVSVRRPGDPLGTRCEIKNVNSIRFIGQAVDTEARRQIGILEDGGTIVLAGLLNGQADAVLAAYRAQGMRLAERSDRVNLAASAGRATSTPDQGWSLRAARPSR